ncbi:MAG: deoxyribose-phosphate aldolase [Bacteroidales bacterium]|nr:deoxyribose-phosphate aldolase [Bacteroidales bacterium]
MNNDFVFENSDFQRVMSEIEKEVNALSDIEQHRVLGSVFTCIDNTTLNGSDSKESVIAFCRNTLAMNVDHKTVASVCIYPNFVAEVKKQLADSGIKVAAVAGGFPAGQIPQRLKIDEVCYVVEEGADEVDFVINRGNFLMGDNQAVFDEVATAKEVCGKDVLLKVIIETGEMQTPANIYVASMLALEAGADFVKTSTGKINVGATPEAAYTMLSAVRDFNKKTKKKVGFKAAGGISSPSEALLYYIMYKKILGKEEINNQYFRIGASRLTAQLFKILTNENR